MPTARLSKLLDYLPPVIAFVAAVTAVIGAPKWNAKAVGLSKITLQGWIVLAIGAMALIASVLVTTRNRGDQARQRQLKEQIAAIGRSQILRALNHTISTFRRSIWRQQCEEPESPIDLLDPERRDILATLNLNSVSPYADGSFVEIKWHSIIERTATKGAQDITTALQIYATYLSPDVMESTTKLLHSSFFQIRLLHLHDLVDANTHRDPNRVVSFFIVKNDEMHNADYEEFWQLTAAVMTLCGAEKTQDGHPKFA